MSPFYVCFYNCLHVGFNRVLTTLPCFIALHLLVSEIAKCDRLQEKGPCAAKSICQLMLAFTNMMISCFENLRLIGLCNFYAQTSQSNTPQNGNLCTCGTCGRTVDVAAFIQPLFHA